MLTIQSIIALRKIKKLGNNITIYKKGNIYYLYRNIDVKSDGFFTVPKENAKPVKIDKSTIEYLKSKNYIHIDKSTLHLSNTGINLTQIWAINSLKTIVFSVIIPIIVSFITAYLTNYYLNK